MSAKRYYLVTELVRGTAVRIDVPEGDADKFLQRWASVHNPKVLKDFRKSGKIDFSSFYGDAVGASMRLVVETNYFPTHDDAEGQALPLTGSDAIRMLRADGFTMDPGLRALTKRFSVSDGERFDEILVIVRDAYELKEPRDGSSRYEAVAETIDSSDPANRARTWMSGQTKRLVFRSFNAADIMAFAIAVENHVRFARYGLDVSDENTFTFQETCISNPFAELQYGDWAAVSGPTDPDVVLAHPAEIFGAGYCRWRDERVKALLEPSVALAP